MTIALTAIVSWVWISILEHQERLRATKGDHRWFAWYPVTVQIRYLDKGYDTPRYKPPYEMKRVWLRVVERKTTLPDYTSNGMQFVMEQYYLTT